AADAARHRGRWTGGLRCLVTRRSSQELVYHISGADASVSTVRILVMNVRLGRNDPCHCGSGKKYKRCHLEQDEQRERDAAREQVALLAHQLAETMPPTPL